MRMRGPCRSPSTATGTLLFAARRRTSAMRSACSSRVPCEKLMRATFMPSSINAETISGVDVDGPSVHTILARGRCCATAAGLSGARVALRSGARRSEAAPEERRLGIEARDQRVERRLEGRDAILQEFVSDVVDVDAERGETPDMLAGGVDVGIDGARHVAVIAKGRQGGRRHRVHRVRTD